MKHLGIIDLLHYGENCYVSGDIHNAKKIFNKILSTQADNVDAINNLGVISFQEGNIIQSIEYFQKALEINPDHKETLINISNLLKNANCPSTAIPFLENLIKNLPDDRDINQLLNEIRPSKSSFPKIAFLSMAGFQSFLEDIIEFCKTKYPVRSCFNDNEPDIEAVIKWADIVWLEFANELTIELTKHPSLLNGKHVICRLHSYEALEGHAELINWKRVNDLIFVAEHIKDIAFTRVSGIQEQIGRIHVVPNGIDPQKYVFKNRDHGMNLAFLGRINYKKGPMLLLHAMRELVRLDRQYRLHIGGKFEDDRYRLYFNQMIKEMSLENNILMEGWVENIPQWLDNKNYIVCTSVLEGHPVGLMEAMAAGIKPIIHNFVGARDYYPERFIWNTIPDFIKMIMSGEYNSEDYRSFVVNNFPLKKQLNNIENIIKLANVH